MKHEPRPEDLRKHLEFVQGVIDRLARSSFIVKGWALTVVAAVYGFAVNQDDWNLALVAVLPTIGFWFLDAYYLHGERKYRKLYDDIRLGEVTDYSMDVHTHGGKKEWLKAAFSLTLSVFYGIAVAFGVVLTYSLARGS